MFRFQFYPSKLNVNKLIEHCRTDCVIMPFFAEINEKNHIKCNIIKISLLGINEFFKSVSKKLKKSY